MITTKLTFVHATYTLVTIIILPEVCCIYNSVASPLNFHHNYWVYKFCSEILLYNCKKHVVILKEKQTCKQEYASAGTYLHDIWEPNSCLVRIFGAKFVNGRKGCNWIVNGYHPTIARWLNFICEYIQHAKSQSPTPGTLPRSGLKFLLDTTKRMHTCTKSHVGAAPHHKKTEIHRRIATKLTCRSSANFVGAGLKDYGKTNRLSDNIPSWAAPCSLKTNLGS